MSEREYRKVITAVREAGDIATLAWLESGLGNGTGSGGILETIFSTACTSFDDAAGKRIAPWLFHAITDASVALYLVIERGRTCLPFSQESRDAEHVFAPRARAEKAMELWAKVPTFRQFPGRYHDSPPEKHSTMIGTKQVILTEICERWRYTKDEAEADKLFVFLAALKSDFQDESEMVQKAVRDAAGGINPARLVRHFIQACEMNCGNNILQILAINWARTSTPEAIRHQFMVVEPLRGCSQVAIDLAEAFTKSLAEKDRAVQILQSTCEYSRRRVFGKIPSPEYEDVPGTLTYRFMDDGAIEVLLSVELSWRSYRTFTDANGHDIFETARRNVQRWHETYPYTVHLCVVATHGGEKAFQRDQLLKPKEKASEA